MNKSGFPVTRMSGNWRPRYAMIATLLIALVASRAAVAVAPGQQDTTSQSATTQSTTTTKATDHKQPELTLKTIMVTAYVPRDTNAAAKMQVPLLETPQAVTVISRAQLDCSTGRASTRWCVTRLA